MAEVRRLVSESAAADVREEIRQKYELAAGAKVDLVGINGAVKIETSDTNVAEVYIERTASCQDALDRRRVTVDADANKLRIRGETIEHNFLAKIFGSKASERVTLKLPRQISLAARGVNGAVVVGELDGPVDLTGINGRVSIENAAGAVNFRGINGNIIAGVKSINGEGVTLNGIRRLTGLLGIAGIVLCYVGIFLVFPITYGAIAIAYEQVFGLSNPNDFGSNLPPPPPAF